jgi:hypothetical protein
MEGKSIAKLERAGTIALVGGNATTMFLFAKSPQFVLEHVHSAMESLRLLR